MGVVPYKSQVARAPMPSNDKLPNIDARDAMAPGLRVAKAGQALSQMGNTAFNYSMEERKQEIETDLLASKVALDDKLRAYEQDVMFSKKGVDARTSVPDADSFFNDSFTEMKKQYENSPVALASLERMGATMRGQLLDQASNYTRQQADETRQKAMIDDAIQTEMAFNNPLLSIEEHIRAGEARKTNIRVNAGQKIVTDKDGKKSWVGGKNVDRELSVVDTTRNLGRINIYLEKGDINAAQSYLDEIDVTGDFAYDKAQTRIDLAREAMLMKAKRQQEQAITQGFLSDTNELMDFTKEMPIEDATFFAYSQIEKLPEGSRKDGLKKAVDDKLKVREDFEISARVVKERDFYNMPEVINSPYTGRLEILEGLHNKGSLSHSEYSYMKPRLLQDLNKVSYENEEALQNFRIEFDNNKDMTEEQKNILFDKGNLTISQRKLGNTYYNNGGNVGDINETRINNIWKELSGDKKAPHGTFEYVIASVKSGHAATDNEIKRIMAYGNVYGEIKSSNVFTFGFGKDATRIEAYRDDKLDEFMTDEEIKDVKNLMKAEGLDAYDNDAVLKYYKDTYK